MSTLDVIRRTAGMLPVVARRRIRVNIELVPFGWVWLVTHDFGGR
jgi:hypothetical protein